MNVADRQSKWRHEKRGQGRQPKESRRRRRRPRVKPGDLTGCNKLTCTAVPTIGRAGSPVSDSLCATRVYYTLAVLLLLSLPSHCSSLAPTQTMIVVDREKLQSAVGEDCCQGRGEERGADDEQDKS